jgi:hypothetical protein
VQGAGYSEFEVATNVAALELEMDMATLELEMAAVSASSQVVCQEISKHEKYSAN